MSGSEIHKTWQEQPMRKPRIDKVVVNIGVGKSGEPLERASKVLKDLSGQTPSKRKAHVSIRDFGVRMGEPIAVIVTLRKQAALDFLKKVLPVVDNKISDRSFDLRGNFSFGIKEHIEIAGVKYDPDIGIFGMDVCVALSRPGYRVGNRRRKEAKIGSSHVLKAEEAKEFVKDALGVGIA